MASRLGLGLAGRRVLCVGVGYKPDVADTRHSRALRVMELLAGSGAVVEFTDPLIASVTLAGVQRKSLALAAASATIERL
jgi:UDP-N-acetyl-D-glucosamine dehydrogenase